LGSGDVGMENGSRWVVENFFKKKGKQSRYIKQKKQKNSPPYYE
jgi:hypothetical protein